MELGQQNISKVVTKRDRNEKVEIFSPFESGENFLIVVHREIMSECDGVRVPNPTDKKYMINKRFSDIANATVTLPVEAGGITLTTGQIALALELITDKFRRPEGEPNVPDNRDY